MGQLPRYDERENVQARGALVPGSKEYEDFYRTHLSWEETDRKIRELPGLGSVGSPLDRPFLGMELGTLLRLSMDDAVDGAVAPETQEISAPRATEKVKGFARHLGAELVAVGPLDPAFVYSHVGKTWGDPARTYGAPIELSHSHAVSLAVALSPKMNQTGPVLPEVVEVMRAYVYLAVIATTLAGYIRSLGFQARAHVMPNYQVLCIPIAIQAGMGRLGRHGVLITEELGSCLKLATVTTTLPLVYDVPRDLGVDEFCSGCARCADSCPGGAVPRGAKKNVRGVEKWHINPEACFRVWNETGTDCGVCVAACPWTDLATRGDRSAMDAASRTPFEVSPVPSWFETPAAVLQRTRRPKLGLEGP